MTQKYENKKLKEGFSYIIGCDEVGRGCLAGPVVAAAVVLDNSKIKNSKLKIGEIKDSKLLSAKKREELSENIKTFALAWSIAEVSSNIVDNMNIHHASLLAMEKAVKGLFECHCEEARASAGRRGNLNIIRKDCFGCTRNDNVFLFVDGKFTIPNFDMRQEAVIGGDNKVLSIAAASIIAKVYRDELMQKLDHKYPAYNFSRHKGYATEYHRTMVLKHGLSPIHRLSFCGKLA